MPPWACGGIQEIRFAVVTIRSNSAIRKAAGALPKTSVGAQRVPLDSEKAVD